MKGFSSFFLTMRCCLCDRIKQRRSPAYWFLWPMSGYELRNLCLYALLRHILYTYFTGTVIFFVFLAVSLLPPIFYLSETPSLCLFHTVYLSRSHPFCLKNFNKSYKSTVSTYLEISTDLILHHFRMRICCDFEKCCILRKHVIINR